MQLETEKRTHELVKAELKEEKELKGLETEELKRVTVEINAIKHMLTDLTPAKLKSQKDMEGPGLVFLTHLNSLRQMDDLVSRELDRQAMMVEQMMSGEQNRFKLIHELMRQVNQDEGAFSHGEKQDVLNGLKKAEAHITQIVQLNRLNRGTVEGELGPLTQQLRQLEHDFQLRLQEVHARVVPFMNSGDRANPAAITFADETIHFLNAELNACIKIKEQQKKLLKRCKGLTDKLERVLKAEEREEAALEKDARILN